jgi:hypothetical protein
LAKAPALFLGQLVGFVNEEDAVQGLVYELVGFLDSATHVFGDQVSILSFLQVAPAEEANIAGNFAH